MIKPDKAAWNDPGQSKRFEETAKQLGVTDDSGPFNRAMGVIETSRVGCAKKSITSKKPKKKPAKKAGL